jgi:hypothetical protein
VDNTGYNPSIALITNRDLWISHIRALRGFVEGAAQLRIEKKGSGQIPGSFVSKGTVHFMHRQDGCPFLV